ncbi:acyl-CoA thioesterase [Pseudolysinimonas sp.]|jgi:acyl-CoA thioester hydrolase|uniref:acyl-CoA thioesterase n=1 Tax=Pseudolysinimonas sp. TaxID=2680009 RepID=UPI0037835F77
MPEPAPTPPLRTTLDLRWADTDQYRHVNNVTAVRLAEEARIRLLGLPEKPEHFPPGAPPVLAVLGTDTFTMTVSQRFEYTAEMPYAGQSVLAEVWLSKIGSRSLTMDCRVGDGAGLTYFIARVSVVIMDLAAHAPRALTASETEHLREYRGEPLVFRD